MRQISILTLAVAMTLNLTDHGFGQTSLREQESQRLADERRQIEEEQKSLAKTRTWLEREKSELLLAQASLQIKKNNWTLKYNQIKNYRDNWRCPDGNGLFECRVHGNATAAAWNYINARVASLRPETDALERERRSFNVRNARFNEQVASFNYRNNEANSRIKRFSADLTDYSRRHHAGSGATEGAATGTGEGGSLVFDESAPKGK